MQWDERHVHCSLLRLLVFVEAEVRRYDEAGKRYLAWDVPCVRISKHAVLHALCSALPTACGLRRSWLLLCWQLAWLHTAKPFTIVNRYIKRSATADTRSVMTLVGCAHLMFAAAMTSMHGQPNELLQLLRSTLVTANDL
jgi:hypothetical protein